MTVFCFQSVSVSEELKSARLYNVFEMLGYVWSNLLIILILTAEESLRNLQRFKAQP